MIPDGYCPNCKWNKSEDKSKFVRCCYPIVSMTNHVCLLKNIILYLAPISYSSEAQTREREDGDWWKGGDGESAA